MDPSKPRKKCIICGPTTKRLFAFPQVNSALGKERYDQWTSFCNKWPTGGTHLLRLQSKYLCQEHFAFNQYQTASKVKLLRTAVPTILPSSSVNFGEEILIIIKMPEMDKKDREVLNICNKTLHGRLYDFTGYGMSERPMYSTYQALVVLMYLSMIIMAVYNILLFDDRTFLMDSMHCATGVYWNMYTLLLRIVTDRQLKRISEMINEGIYIYEDEDSDEEYIKIKMSLRREYITKTRIYKTIYVISFTMVMIVSPILCCLYIPEDSELNRDEAINVYIPHYFYVPFSTRMPLGFAVAYGMDFLVWLYAFTTTYVTVNLVMWVGLQTTLHLRILNYSLSTVHGRAIRLYRKNFGQQGEEPPGEGVLKSKEFQECLFWCLRANVRHHQTLIMFKEEFNTFIGTLLFGIYSAIVAVLYAALLYLFLQPLPISLRLKYFFMLAAEETSGFFISVTGEDIISESSKVFHTLYGTSWFNYDKKFKQTVHIMMSYTREPMAYKTTFLDVKGSKESFGELVKVTYSIMNLIGPSKQMDQT